MAESSSIPLRRPVRRTQIVVAALASTVLALALAACASQPQTEHREQQHHASGTASPHPTESPSPSGAASQVPAGFEPTSFTAISETDFWVLGGAPCSGGTCTYIAHTTNGGASFSLVNSPPLGAPNTGQAPVLRFTDQEDGFAYIPRATGEFFATHNGGNSWHAVALGEVLNFASAGGYAYAITASCPTASCLHFQRSPVSSDSWQSSSLPFSSDRSSMDLEAHGPDVWLMGTPTAPQSPQLPILARSSDQGASFTNLPSPCLSDLGGAVAPSSVNVLWAVCPTGMQAYASRSTDGGSSFTSLNSLTSPMPNSAQLAPASDTTAVLAYPDPSGWLRTTDGGTSWSAVSTAADSDPVLFIGFTDAEVGVALVSTGQGADSELWRTTDAGASWALVNIS